jgi:hypothetical protein
MTVLALISAALRQIGELSAGQVPNDEEALAGLELLNAILESWENARRKVFIIDNLQFPLIDGVGVYTMGPGGDFDSYRPVKIQAANVIFSGDGGPGEGICHPLELVPSRVWADIREKALEAQRPLRLYNNNDFPLLRLYIWPVPRQEA